MSEQQPAFRTYSYCVYCQRLLRPDIEWSTCRQCAEWERCEREDRQDGVDQR